MRDKPNAQEVRHGGTVVRSGSRVHDQNGAALFHIVFVSVGVHPGNPILKPGSLGVRPVQGISLGDYYGVIFPQKLRGNNIFCIHHGIDCMSLFLQELESETDCFSRVPKIIAEKQDFHKPVHPFCRCGTACGKPSLVSITKK